MAASLSARVEDQTGPAITGLGLRAEILAAGAFAGPWFPLGRLVLDQPIDTSRSETGWCQEPLVATADITDVIVHSRLATVRLIVSADTADGRHHRSILSALLTHDLRSAAL